MEKVNVFCLKCEKQLHQTVCMVENAGLVTVDFTYVSKFYGGLQAKGYICDECYENNSHLFCK
jgi:hypothetical protein